MQRQRIYNSLRSQNEPAIVDGIPGFWCQADCVFVPADNPTLAIQRYRRDVSAALIGISHNMHCDSIRRVVRDEEGGAA